MESFRFTISQMAAFQHGDSMCVPCVISDKYLAVNVQGVGDIVTLHRHIVTTSGLT